MTFQRLRIVCQPDPQPRAARARQERTAAGPSPGPTQPHPGAKDPHLLLTVGWKCPGLWLISTIFSDVLIFEGLPPLECWQAW